MKVQDLLEIAVAIGKLEETRRAEKKIKPDSETYPVGPDGVASTTPTFAYSKAKLEELKKNRELQKKLEDAISKALDGDFTKVKEIAAKGAAPADEG